MSYKTIKNLVRSTFSHTGFQKHFKNISWMFFAKILSIAVSLLATTYVARHLGPANYGQLSYAISFVAIFSVIAALGIDQVLYRDLVEHPTKRKIYIGSAITLRLIASVITMILCLVSAFFFSQNDVSLFLIFIISFSFIFSSFHLITYEFQADVRQKYPYLLVLFVTIILNILKIFIIFNDKGIIYLALIMLLEPLLYTLGYIYLHKKIYKDSIRLEFDKKIALSILKNSYPLMFASAFFVIYARIDQVMIKNMMDSTSVGLYSSAATLSEIWYFVPSLILSGLFPAIVNAKKTSTNLYLKRAKNLLVLIFVISFTAAILTTFAAKYITLIVFGSGFLAAYPVLQIYVWSNIGGALNSFMQQILITENATKIISIATFMGMLSNVFLNIILIPTHGIKGAAYASLISYFVPIITLLFFKTSRRILFAILKQ